MKRILALITVLTILFAMAVPALADDSYVAVSVGKPIEALVGPGEGNPQYANDDSTTSRYTGNKSYTENALTIDLERKYVLDHVIVFASNAATSSVYVSNDSDFTTYVELEFDRTESYVNYYKIPSNYAGSAYRYVRYNFTASTRDVLVRNFQAYVTEENAGGTGPQLTVPTEFEEDLVVASLNKPILSKTHGEGTGWENHVVANAVDDDLNTKFLGIPNRNQIEWVTIDLEEAVVINKITAKFDVQKTYSVHVTNTSYGQEEEITDGIQLEETSAGSKVFKLPEEHKNTAFQYVRLRFEGDEPNTGSDTEQNVTIYDISVYTSSRDLTYNAAAEKGGKLTDGDIETPANVANNTVIDLLAPTYISSYELFGADKDNVTIKGSLFNTTVDNMTVIPEKTTENIKYRYIAIESDSGEAVSLNEIEIFAFFTDIATPWILDENICSVTVTNTSHKDERTYTFTVTAFDEYGAVLDIKTKEETLANGETKKAELELAGLEFAKKVVCTVERDGILVSAPTIFIDGEKVEMPAGTPYEAAPSKDIESAVTKTDYFDGLKLNITGTDTNGVVDSDIITFCVYDQSGNLIISDAWFADSEFEYRLPGDAPAGEYEAKLSITDAFGNTYKNKYEFTKAVPTEDDIASAIETFRNVTTNEEFKAAYQEHYVTKGTISFSDIPEAEILLENALGDSFIKMLSARPLWKNNAGTNLTVEDIRDCIKAAVIENTLESGGEKAPVILSKYASVLDNVFDGKQNNVYTAELFKTGAQDNETLIYNMKIAAALSRIKNASSVTIADVLEEYSDILSVDLEAIEDSGVDILLVAKRLDNTIPDSYKDGLEDEIDKILAKNKVPSSSGGGSSGGGGYGVKGDSSKDEKDPVTPEPEEPIVPETPEIPEIPKEPEETKDEEIVRFSDVADNFWAFDSIQALAGAEIISGRGDGSFDPDSEVSRAEFATMLVRAFGLISKPEEKPEFTDCRISDWFYPYIDAAISNDIVKGISATEFAPGASISRQDACVMSYNIMVCKNYLKFFTGKEFSDSDAVAAYAKDAVDMLSGSGVISGFTDGSFGPQKPLSRAQAAVIIHKLMVLLGEEV